MFVESASKDVWRWVIGQHVRELTRSRELWNEARRHLAGGVSSDARRVPEGRVPLYVDHAAGAWLTDVDGNRYADYVLGQGPLVFGHSHPRIVAAVAAQMARGQVYSAQHATEVEVAARVCELVPCAELVRFNSVGSEAVHASWRLARGVTGRPKILKFEGHYHGWLDQALFSVHPPVDLAGGDARPSAVPGSAGVPPRFADNLVVAPWNDLTAFEQLLDEHDGQIAAVILEPWLCNTGAIPAAPGFLEAIRARTKRDGIVLIFDEIITGFRLAPGGAQEYLGVQPDLAVFGKAMAGGLPLSCLAGTEDVMGAIADGAVGHAGTFNSNPVVMAAADAALQMIQEGGAAMYDDLHATGQQLMQGITKLASDAGQSVTVEGPGSVFQTYWTNQPEVRNYRDFARCDAGAASDFHDALLDDGVHMVRRGLWFLSTAHDDDVLQFTLRAIERALDGSDTDQR